MRSLFRAFDNFFFKAFDIMGRSSRAEYWCVMPILWAIMGGLFWIDLRGIDRAFSAGEIPSLNPLAYGSVLFILVTAIPRLTLSIRRLQDSGRRARWVTMPYSAAFLALMGFFGLATSGAFVVEGDFTDAGVPIAMALSFGSAEGAAVAVYEILSNIENIRFVGQLPASGEIASAISNEAMGGPAATLPMLFMLAIMFLYPPLAMMLYTLFMSLPSDEDENAYGLPTNLGHGPKRSSKGEHNAFASYAILTRQGHKMTQEEIVARREAVHSLYESRVLGRR